MTRHHGNPIVTTLGLDFGSHNNRKIHKRFACVSRLFQRTRASLLTGRQFYRAGVSGVHGWGQWLLNRDETLLTTNVKTTKVYASVPGVNGILAKSQGYNAMGKRLWSSLLCELYQHNTASTRLLKWRKSKVHQAWGFTSHYRLSIEFNQDTKHQQKTLFCLPQLISPHEPCFAPDENMCTLFETRTAALHRHIYGM